MGKKAARGSLKHLKTRVKDLERIIVVQQDIWMHLLTCSRCQLTAMCDESAETMRAVGRQAHKLVKRQARHKQARF